MLWLKAQKCLKYLIKNAILNPSFYISPAHLSMFARRHLWLRAPHLFVGSWRLLTEIGRSRQETLRETKTQKHRLVWTLAAGRRLPLMDHALSNQDTALVIWRKASRNEFYGY